VQALKRRLEAVVAAMHARQSRAAAAKAELVVKLDAADTQLDCVAGVLSRMEQIRRQMGQMEASAKT
jgi:hypothetical protein